MKKLIKIIAPVAVLFGGIMLVQAMIAAKPAPEKKEETQRLISLFYDQVTEETVTLSVGTQGEVRPKNEVDLFPQVSGRIVSISEAFADGAGFDGDTTLVKIDDSEYRLAVTRAEARVSEAELKLLQEKAQASIKRQQWASSGRTSEPTPLQVNLPQITDAEAKLRSAQADLEEARMNLARTSIKVPFSGRVAERNVGVGQIITPSTRLGRVFSTDTVEVRLPLTDSQLLELDLPMGFVAPAGQGPEVSLSADLGGIERFWTGRIVRVQAAVDQQTRLIYAVAEVQDPYGEGADDGIPLAVGLFVTADIDGVNAQTALVMPREALRNANEVYVINDDDKLEIRTVNVLSTSEERAVVTSGVVAGERVVVSTLANPVDGMAVQPIEPVAMN